MIRVYGFEGSWTDDCYVAWGAAALLLDDGLIRNAYSKLTIAQHVVESDGSQESIAKLPPDVEIDDEYALSDVTVVALRRTSRSFLFTTRKGKQSGEIARRPYGATGLVYYVFSDRQSFDKYVEHVVAKVVGHILKEEKKPDSEKLDIIYDALVLAPHDPYLHGLRVLAASDREATRELAESSLRDEDDRRAFSQFVDVCTRDDFVYRLKYDRGIGEGGGLEIKDAKRQFEALETVESKLIPFVRRANPYLPSDTQPAPRVLLKTGSAELEFSVKVKDQSLLQRIARFLEIQRIQDVVRGNVPDVLAQDKAFTEALDRLVKPTAETVVTHKPLDKSDTEYEDVVVSPFVSGETIDQGPFSILGAPQAATREIKRIDLRLSMSMREAVSVEDSGGGGPPLGSALFRKRNDFLFRPFVFSVWRRIDSSGRHRFWLQSVKPLEHEQSEVVFLSAIPSLVNPGGFMTSLQLPVSLAANGVVSIAGATVGAVLPHNLETWAEFMSSFTKWCGQYELEHGLDEGVEWIQPPRPTIARSVRIALALQELGGTSTVSRVRDFSNQRFGKDGVLTTGLVNKMAEDFPEFFSLDEREDDDFLILREKGIRLISIYRRATAVPASESE